MADPAAVTTAEQLMDQLRMLLEQTRMAPEKLAGLAGVSENTVRGMAKGSARFPQQSTLETVVRACNQETKPWIDAWHRASDARVRSVRTGAARDTQLQIDELTDVVRRLCEQVATLIELQTGQDQEQSRHTRKERAYHRFLNALPSAQFLSVQWSSSDRLSPSRPPEMPAYYAESAEAKLAEIGNMIRDQNRLPELLTLLNHPGLTPVRSWTPYEEGTSAPHLVSQADVDLYFAELRECLQDYFAELSGEEPPTPRWVVGRPH